MYFIWTFSSITPIQQCFCSSKHLVDMFSPVRVDVSNTDLCRWIKGQIHATGVSLDCSQIGKRNMYICNGVLPYWYTYIWCSNFVHNGVVEYITHTITSMRLSMLWPWRLSYVVVLTFTYLNVTKIASHVNL